MEKKERKKSERRRKKISCLDIDSKCLGESREKAENGKLFKRASTQWAKKTSPVEGGTSQG